MSQILENPSARLKNGVRAGSIVRVYREHRLRFAKVLHVISRPGIRANVTVQYLDFDQEEAKVFGNVVQPVTAGWIHDMKERFEDVRDVFNPSINGTVEAQTLQGPEKPRRLKNGITSGSLVRVYQDHQMRFARVLAIYRLGLPTTPNVSLQYLDGDHEEDKVFGIRTEPVTQEWIQDLESRMDAISKLMAAKRAERLSQSQQRATSASSATFN